MHVNISVTVKTAGRISLNDGRKLEESEGYNYSRLSLSRTSWDLIKMFELSVVQDNHNCDVIGMTTVRLSVRQNVLGRHMYMAI